MNKHILDMVKKVSVINLLFGMILACLVQLFFKSYGLFILLGVSIAIFNFFINTIVGAIISERFRNSSASLYIISFIIRVVMAAGIGYWVFICSKYNVVAYLIGYTSHLLGIYIYSLIENN
ncbi:hypothetical protein CLRAG_27970 [Clostridium ragsdalei P11]|uniref:ATP synthase I chain n=1 Tax=Clostridium ragsdalei P11 TaxID=1353534 RepID=A0A1A6AP49_9CLOT|nr:ATP synthase subunit I [Clostridium ragsdalei]OBR91818.1 hypothetical protein CLRAG_27970 [Clostridium ragsdalei P11]